MKTKYFCILAYKHETDYKGMSHRQRVWPGNRAIHKRENQPGLNRQRIYNLRLKINRLLTFTKWPFAGLYR